jgi:hypothetical protein
MIFYMHFWNLIYIQLQRNSDQHWWLHPVGSLIALNLLHSPFVLTRDIAYTDLQLLHSHAHNKTQFYINCATQIVKRKEMLCTAVFLGRMTTETDPTFVLNSVDVGFYLSGYVNCHSKIYQFVENHRFTNKAPIHVRKVCLWSAIGATNTAAAIVNLQAPFFISCLVATKPQGAISFVWRLVLGTEQ